REKRQATITSISYVRDEEVFTTTVEDETHAYGAQGFINQNCSEQMLHDGDVCNLGAINLSKFVREPTKEEWTKEREDYSWEADIDWAKLSNAVRLAVRMQDNVIDLTEHPVEKVNKTARGNRRIGLGVMGFAEMLYWLRVPYNTVMGRAVASKVMFMI